ncbi:MULTISPECIES: DMT family transporter [Halomonadaceae]|jgi:drug/metabolite transporter (DMT)-like permease|uniref:Drug/metabolite transporter n=2 Tax=Vreelandella titanicae TaxID=664683 RepID=L9U9A8_9GAMM|nr:MULTISPECIES: DMT family transporter [Halomonas]NAO95145.1 EamA family transporter [Halomonas sp. MG34]UEQ02560.1 DMT family transporter [Halomonas profundus]ELY21221.1 Drug/metabolite transporter [Halomonas titanicae BH1]MCD1584665.1 DMT family transporter [Halomonas sp. IOP_14]MCE7518321.1 DMT family transporter [Halomonas titanicae]|tara:strand:- start:13530 stop:14402 length:873 start_codon:yes stop_codon:yes gene_type:complete
MNQDRQAILFGLGAVALWSTVATAFKVALAWMSPLELMWLAALVSWALMGALVIKQGNIATALRTGWKTAAWAGLMNPVAYYLVLFAAYDRLPGQEAMALNYTWALAMAFLAVPLLGQRLTRMDIVAGLVAYAGVWVIATRGAVLNVSFADPLGVVLALASTLLWALYWLLNARDSRPPLVGQWQNFSVGLPVLTLLLLLGPGYQWHGWPAFGAGVYVGLFEMGVAFILWQLAVHKVSRTAKVSNLIFLSPPVSLLLLFLVVGEPILPSTLIGLVLILLGLGLQQAQKNE